jgi:high-affinity K+ transport system ATPase subunit B
MRVYLIRAVMVTGDNIATAQTVANNSVIANSLAIYFRRPSTR